jgi:hypothetical protein
MSDPNADRERLADQAMGRDPDESPSGEPWAKTSSGDADNVTPDDNDEGEDDDQG